jgi:hypothetical protein
MKSQLTRSVAVAALAVAGCGVAAHADLVTNGGFETGNFSGWTLAGNTGFTGVSSGSYAHSGVFGASFGPVGSTGNISQSLIAAAGSTIQVSFWLVNFGGPDNSFSATLDGFSLMTPIVNAQPFGYTQYTATVTVTNANPILTFTYQQNPSFFGLDSITANVVPLPPAVLAGLGGLASVGIVGAIRRRRVAK